MRRISFGDGNAGAGSKFFTFAGNLRVKRRRIKRADAVNAATAGDEVAPEGFQVVPERRHHTQAGDDDTAFRQIACHKN